MKNFLEAVKCGDLSQVNEKLKDSEGMIAMRLGKMSLLLAAKKGFEKIIEVLLHHPQVLDNIAAKNNEALRLAAAEGHVKSVALLLNYDDVVDNVTAVNNFALREAAENGHRDVVDVLLGHDAVVRDITALSNAALTGAAMNGHHGIVKKLLRYKPVQNEISAANYWLMKELTQSDNYGMCYILAKRCWGNIQQVPPALKSQKAWEKIRQCIHKGAREAMKEIWRGYLLQRICVDGFIRIGVKKPAAESIQRIIARYLLPDLEWGFESVYQIEMMLMEVRAKKIVHRPLLSEHQLTTGLFCRHENLGVNNNPVRADLAREQTGSSALKRN